MNTNSIKAVSEKQVHTIPPLYGKNSRVLILGSFPSVKSREQGFFYGHPQNRFWKVVSGIFNCDMPETVQEKTDLVLNNGLALWDVIAECEIVGSGDSSIKNVIPNDLSKILLNADIQKIFVNGKTAEKYYIKYQQHLTGKKAVCLPSTSPANAMWNIEKLIAAWEVIKQ